jgi:hypothetical protein
MALALHGIAIRVVSAHTSHDVLVGGVLSKTWPAEELFSCYRVEVAGAGVAISTCAAPIS